MTTSVANLGLKSLRERSCVSECETSSSRDGDAVIGRPPGSGLESWQSKWQPVASETKSGEVAAERFLCVSSGSLLSPPGPRREETSPSSWGAEIW